MKALVSIVIPTRNEGGRIERCLRHLSSLPGNWETIVADGGSQDGTREMVGRFPKVRCVEGKGTRGAQMNRGVREAKGEILLFLHADVELPSSAYSDIENRLRLPSVVAGAFRTWTVPEHSRSRCFAVLLHLADFRSRYTGLPYGDQAIFVRREIFDELGGFRDLELMEDLDFSRRLRRKGKIQTVKATVRVSGRRFERAALRYTFLVNVFPLLFRMGVSPRTLSRFYADVR